MRATAALLRFWYPEAIEKIKKVMEAETHATD
jgi:hypothetical protein